MQIDDKKLIELINESGLVNKTDIGMAEKKHFLANNQSVIFSYLKVK